MRTVAFHFDFVSPFAYLASQRLDTLYGVCRLEYRPVLFAAMLNHYDTRGPAEIAPMRRFTYRHITWLAHRHGIALRMPPRHPFNPIPLLRLALLLDCRAAVVDRLFRFVWAEAGSSDDASAWSALCAELGVLDPDTQLAAPSVKQALRENTDRALASGVFGVPVFEVDGELFWGFDSIDFLRDYLADPAILTSTAMRAADAIPLGQVRARGR